MCAVNFINCLHNRNRLPGIFTSAACYTLEAANANLAVNYFIRRPLSLFNSITSVQTFKRSSSSSLYLPSSPIKAAER